MSDAYSEWRTRWPSVVVERDTETAQGLLERYSAVRKDGSPRYTGSQFEAIAHLNPYPNRLGPADLIAVSALSVEIPALAAIRLLDDSNSAQISHFLRKIPADVDIVDVEPEALTGDSAAGQLWRFLRAGKDGIGRTRASKLLAAKRPRLLPIWDSFVEKATGLDTSDNWRKFQSVLCADDEAIWRWLTELKREFPFIPVEVAPLRVLDILLWKSTEESQSNENVAPDGDPTR
jgi:hypothetical protein